MCSSGSSSCTRMGTSPMGMFLLPSMRATSISQGSRTSSSTGRTSPSSCAFTSSGMISKSTFSMAAPSSISVVRRCGVGMLLDAKFLDAAATELIHVVSAIAHTVHPALQPFFRVIFRFCLFVILAKESIIAFIAALNRRGMRAVAAFDHGRDEKTRNDGAIRIARDDLERDHLFRDYNHVLCGAHRLDHHAKISPAVRIALAVGALHMNDGDIGIEGAHGEQRFLAVERRSHRFEKLVGFWNVAAHHTARGQIRHAHG